MASSSNTDTDKSIQWIENGIKNRYLIYYERSEFQNQEFISEGTFYVLYKTNWGSFNTVVTLKSFKGTFIKEIVNEIQLLNEIHLHANIIKFVGITKRKNNEFNNDSDYSLILEYADGGTLRNYLKENFDKLDLNIKLQFAIQISDAVSYLHQKNIIHCGLNSKNILVHQNKVKLADFSLSRRLDEMSSPVKGVIEMLPYTDPLLFEEQKERTNNEQCYKANKKSDVYSVGLLLWEILSGRLPFESRSQKLILELQNRKRERPVPRMANKYVDIYTGCLQSNPNDRPNIREVLSDLKSLEILPMEMDENSFDLDNYEVLIDRMYEKFLQEGGINKDNFNLLINQYITSNNNNENEILKYLSDNIDKQENIILLGEFFRQGIGTEKDEIKAFELYKAAAENGNIKSIYQLGEYYFYGIGTKKNVIKAVEMYKEAAGRGDVNAINDLGYCYQHGIGTEKDEINAFELYKIAAEKGDITSMNNLGECYQRGIGTMKDEIKAFELYKELAEEGHTYSIYDLGYCYQHGIGTEKNETKALELYKVVEKEMDNIGKSYQHEIKTEKDEIKAFELFKKAAEKGHIASIYQLGECHYYGIGTGKNEKKAFELYKKGNEKDHTNSIFMLGHCYQYGIGTRMTSEIMAFEYYKIAAEKGHVSSISNLGYCYQFGIGTKKNEIKALELYKKAAERGNEQHTQITYSFSNVIFNYNEMFNQPSLCTSKKNTAENNDNFMDLNYEGISGQSSSRTLKNITSEQIIKQFKLNHGIILTEENIRPSIRAIIVEDGVLKMNLYTGQPLIYKCINYNDHNEGKPLDMCINFPIAKIIYNGDLVNSFGYYDESTYGHFLARKFLAGGQLFIKDFNLATSAQINILKFYLFFIYNSAKCSAKIQFNNLFDLDLLPKIITMDGEELNTHKKLTKWMDDLYQKKTATIISYNNLIPINQLRYSTLSIDNLESFNEKQPGVANFKERLTLEEWIGDEVYDNLVSWTEDFQLFQGLIINGDYEITISKEIAVNFIEVPEVNLSEKVYSKKIKPSTNMEVILISNNIFSIKDLSTFPFIKSNTKEYEDYAHILLKCERYEILLDENHIKPTKEFEQLIENALNSMRPLEALQNIFNEYGHLFPQKIILGRSLKNILSEKSTFKNPDMIPTTSYDTDIDMINVNSELKISDISNLSYLLTQEGEVVEKNDIHNWINANNNLEVIEFDNIIPLYKILKVEQQRKIDDILKNDHRIIMTGITDLKDLDNKNAVHYKRINLNPQSLLEDEDYEVFGSIISGDNTVFAYVNFGLYDINGFYAIIKKLEGTNVDITKCDVLWMIVGNPSKLLVLSPKNRELQVGCIKKSITIQFDKSNYCIKSPFPLSHGYTISVYAYYSSTNYEPINIKLFEWNKEYINFQIKYNKSNIITFSDTQLDEEIDLHICFLSTIDKNLKIDYEIIEFPLDLVGYTLSKENFNGKLPSEIASDSVIEMNNDIEMDMNYELSNEFTATRDSDIEMDINYELSSEIESTATNDSDIEMDNNDQLTIGTSHRTNINKYDSQVPRKKSNSNINTKEKGRYSTSELIEVLTFINDNFDLWNASPPIACSKAIEATNINRDSTSVYKKIHSLIRNVSEYFETGKKSSPNAMIWKEKKIYDLVEKIWKNKKSEGDNEINFEKYYDNKTKIRKKVEEEIDIKTEMTDEVIQNFIDQVRKESEEKIVEKRKMEEKIIAKEKIIKIKEMEVEIIQMVRNINNKYKQLKEIQ
ncbi:uncharacterized protein OCT59_019037 [Rhizophagus irregularis]|uniref:Bck1p n=3 Tax=Rhizophagus irregularis TaxID=588596 RepID=A0A015KWG5_RHIIW|nr:Bck1p [Rhizophagus irregularis DAOM 197198w]UZO26824.1 hypothetical protein OCT59_019037 [Rhizophagus irregularis]